MFSEGQSASAVLFFFFLEKHQNEGERLLGWGVGENPVQMKLATANPPALMLLPSNCKWQTITMPFQT